MFSRPVQTADLPHICRFATSAEELFFAYPKAHYPLDVTQLAAAIAQRTHATVIEHDGAVAAFANFYRWEHGGSCAIGNVLVAPAQRGRGVGRFLIGQMCQLAWQHYAASEVTVSCFNHNTAGLLFYPQLGFQVHAVEARQTSSGETCALLHFRLPRPAAP
ncbi:GNAT family N-acetyltransferase [Vogesella alkaliphila]|uniref:GNAT family N-acetyltransferase n=1 Tax=Vogesella alkaliphila TaxID=1193621 RepID=A0ABQ2YDN8_9NEIS|nr:GNAT family N-acetyltransferase [Vogesella alkaliphila]GGX78356.1 GNAT family N-acetyltransferase [Vogesella alkaliphila]